MTLPSLLEDHGCWIEDLAEDASIEEKDIIEGILPSGLSLLIGSPKAGKTNFIKQAAADIAVGGNFLNAFSCQAGRACLMLYEGSKGNVWQSFKGKGIPKEAIYYSNNFTKADAGGLIELKEIVNQKRFKVIVIDTFGVFKGSAKLNRYENQYREFEALNKAAEDTNTALIIVSHTKRTAQKNEVGSAGYGISGLVAVATSSLVLSRDHTQDKADLRIESRKGPDRHLKLKMDSNTLEFEYRGEVDSNYASDEAIAVLKFLNHQPWPFNPREIADELDLSNKSVYNILQKLNGRQYVYKPRRGLYMITEQGIVKAEQS